MTQSPVLPSQPLLQQNSECGPSRSTLGSGLLGVPGQGRCKREGAGEDLGPWGPSTGSLVPTRSLSHPVSKQMKKVGVGQGQKTRRNHVTVRPRTRRREGPLPPAQVRPQQTWEASIRFHHHFSGRNELGIRESEGLGKLCLSAFSREGSRLSGLYLEKVFKEVIRLK